MRWFVSCVSLVLVACGSHGAEFDQSVAQESEESRTQGERLEFDLREYAQALLSSNSEQLRLLLATALLERIDARGGMDVFIAREAAKLRRELGPDASAHSIAVSDIGVVRNRNLAWVVPTLNGVPTKKSLWFVREDRGLKLALQLPRNHVAAEREEPGSLSTEIGVTMQVLGSSSTYRIDNLRGYTKNFRILVNGAWQEHALGPFVSKRLAGDDRCDSAFDGGWFKGKSGSGDGTGVWSNTFECDWNTWGVDFFNSNQDQWQCNDVC